MTINDRTRLLFLVFSTITAGAMVTACSGIDGLPDEPNDRVDAGQDAAPSMDATLSDTALPEVDAEASDAQSTQEATVDAGLAADSAVDDAAADATVDAGPCQAEDNGAFCTRQGKNCGTFSGFDNCGTLKTVASCGVCSSYYESCGGGGQASVCGCLPESDWAFCTRTGHSCGSASGTDNCGNARTALSCGGVCPADAGAGDATVGDGGGVQESDPELCTRLNLQCGLANVVDLAGQMRTASCGSCAAGLSCGQQNPNRCSDNNECAGAQICPSDSDCFNTPGSYRCETKTELIPLSTQHYLPGSDSTRFTLVGAGSYCSVLALRSGVWHLATSAELFRIHGDVPPYSNPYNSSVGAGDTMLWSSTPLVGVPATMSVNRGTLYLRLAIATALAGATCVEGPPPGAELQRFVAMQDAVIRDDMLGISWVVSQTACDRTTTAGGGWRYPRASEAISLVAEIAGVPLQKLGAPVFSNSQRLLGTTRFQPNSAINSLAWLFVELRAAPDGGVPSATIETGVDYVSIPLSAPYLCAR
jgi:hypothetical protein